MKIIVLSMVAFAVSCAAMSPYGVKITADDILKLDDQTKSYVYVGDYYYLPMRPGHGVGILEVTIDSATLDNDRVLCIRGSLSETLYQKEVSGTSVFIGKIDTLDARIINKDAPHRQAESYQIRPMYEVSSDSSGRFRICGTIDAGSYLVVASKGNLICLYHVGRLVKNSARSTH